MAFHLAPTDQDILDAQEHVQMLTRKRELCAKRDQLTAQLEAIDAELRTMPMLATAHRRTGAFVRFHQRMGLA